MPVSSLLGSPPRTGPAGTSTGREQPLGTGQPCKGWHCPAASHWDSRPPLTVAQVPSGYSPYIADTPLASGDSVLSPPRPLSEWINMVHMRRCEWYVYHPTHTHAL
eukprot:3577374-Karenia_brevis.AAC.1